VTIISPPAPTVRHSMLATLCALTGVLTFTGAAAQTVNAAGFAPETCPNEQFRAEQPFALALPDCRAYEQVSPLNTNGSDAVIQQGEVFFRASVSGEAITYNSFGSFAEPTGSAYESQYVSRRGPGDWSTQNITPPFDAIITSSAPPYEYLTFTPELSSGLTESTTPLTSEATAGYINLYRAEFAEGASESSYELLTNSAYVPLDGAPYEHLGAGGNAIVQGASTDLSHVVFYYNGTTYEWVNGKSYKVNIAPNGTAMTVYGPVGEAGRFWRSVSADGLRVFMTSGAAPYQVYVRENPEQPQSPLNGEECMAPGDACTIEVSASQRTTADPNGPQPALYMGANVEGSRVFFTSRAELTEDAKTGPADNAENLYEYDLEKPAGERLTDLTVDTKDTDGAGVLGVVDISEDGSYVYLVAEGVLASNENANRETATPGQPNLYLDHDGTTTFIATLSSRDSEDWSTGNSTPDASDSALYTVRETADGTHLAFLSTMSLTGYDNEQAATGECEGIRTNTGPAEEGQCSEVYEYNADASGEALTCASCNPSGARPVGQSSFGGDEGSALEPYVREHYTSRNFSEDGSRLFFQSKDALVPKDSNGLQNVFEYEDGHVYRISDVAGGYYSSFMDASANGDDVFIATTDRLLPQDTGLRSAVYDARVDGGYPVSVSAPACDNADSCKGPVSPQPSVFGAPASATFSGAGNLAPVVAVKPVAKAKPKRCKKGFAKKHGKCVKQKAKRSSTHSKQGTK